MVFAKVKLGGSRVVRPQGGAHREGWILFFYHSDSLSLEVQSELSQKLSTDTKDQTPLCASRIYTLHILGFQKFEQ